jgi:hypothetical protein
MYGPRAQSGYQFPGLWKNVDVVPGRAAWNLLAGGRSKRDRETVA